MSNRPVTATLLLPEVDFITSRSGGPGGQNVNKVNTKVTLKFDVQKSRRLTEEEKSIVLEKLASRVTNDGVVILISQDKRSQLENKEAVIKKFQLLLIKVFQKKKKRLATKPSKASVQKRKESKKRASQKKELRRRPE
jgi:ribosome-associated protein